MFSQNRLGWACSVSCLLLHVQEITRQGIGVFPMGLHNQLRVRVVRQAAIRQHRVGYVSLYESHYIRPNFIKQCGGSRPPLLVVYFHYKNPLHKRSSSGRGSHVSRGVMICKLSPACFTLDCGDCDAMWWQDGVLRASECV